jgi:hypothetical protein
VRDSYKGQDGIKRNLMRYRDEWLDFQDYWKEGNHVDSHDPVTNWFVEMSRHVPWLAGHLWRNSIIVLAAIAIWGWA